MTSHLPSLPTARIRDCRHLLAEEERRCLLASSQNAGGRQLSLQGWALGNYRPKEEIHRGAHFYTEGNGGRKGIAY